MDVVFALTIFYVITAVVCTVYSKFFLKKYKEDLGIADQDDSK